MQVERNDPHSGQPVLHTGAALEQAPAAMIMIHGRGASAHDILGLAGEFERPDLAEIAPDTPIDLVGHLGSRNFGGFESLQIEILDAAPVGRLGSASSDQASLTVPA